ncbi:hypothetical protein B0H13DRAFT_2342112 [Mycena leptocephala]|nr:hypothetical protein B0H13DRAFT_2342112 [Mycena leptocephala]
MVARMLAPGPVVQPDSFEECQSRLECDQIMDDWRRRDRSAILSYTHFLGARLTMEAKIACSKAVAGKRTAVHYPFEFGRWLEQHATSTCPLDPFGDAPHEPGAWHLYRNSDGTWGPHGGIMDVSRWVASHPRMTQRPAGRGWGDHGWGSGWPGHRDPDWDGIPVPKTPGKAKRRRQRRHERHEAQKRDAALWTAQRYPQQLSPPMLTAPTPLDDRELEAAGWGTGTGWGTDTCNSP